MKISILLLTITVLLTSCNHFPPPDAIESASSSIDENLENPNKHEDATSKAGSDTKSSNTETTTKTAHDSIKPEAASKDAKESNTEAHEDETTDDDDWLDDDDTIDENDDGDDDDAEDDAEDSDDTDDEDDFSDDEGDGGDRTTPTKLEPNDSKPVVGDANDKSGSAKPTTTVHDDKKSVRINLPSDTEPHDDKKDIKKSTDVQTTTTTKTTDVDDPGEKFTPKKVTKTPKKEPVTRGKSSTRLRPHALRHKIPFGHADAKNARSLITENYSKNAKATKLFRHIIKHHHDLKNELKNNRKKDQDEILIDAANSQVLQLLNTNFVKQSYTRATNTPEMLLHLSSALETAYVISGFIPVCMRVIAKNKTMKKDHPALLIMRHLEVLSTLRSPYTEGFSQIWAITPNNYLVRNEYIDDLLKRSFPSSLSANVYDFSPMRMRSVNDIAQMVNSQFHRALPDTEKDLTKFAKSVVATKTTKDLDDLFPLLTSLRARCLEKSKDKQGKLNDGVKKTFDEALLLLDLETARVHNQAKLQHLMTAFDAVGTKLKSTTFISLDEQIRDLKNLYQIFESARIEFGRFNFYFRRMQAVVERMRYLAAVRDLLVSSKVRATLQFLKQPSVLSRGKSDVLYANGEKTGVRMKSDIYFLEALDPLRRYFGEKEPLVKEWQKSKEVNFYKFAEEFHRQEMATLKGQVEYPYQIEELSYSQEVFIVASRNPFSNLIDVDFINVRGELIKDRTDIGVEIIYVALKKNEKEKFRMYHGVSQLAKIHHSGIADGNSVYMAGTISFNGDKIILDNQSGHFCPSKMDMDAFLPEFEKALLERMDKTTVDRFFREKLFVKIYRKDSAGALVSDPEIPAMDVISRQKK